MRPSAIKILLAKAGLDGHDRGLGVIARALRDSGMEVIYLGIHQTPETIVRAAIEENVDVVAISVLSGAHMALFPRIDGELRKAGMNVLVTGGGIIPDDDKKTLEASGIGKLFDPGSPTRDIVEYIRSWHQNRPGAVSGKPSPLKSHLKK